MNNYVYLIVLMTLLSTVVGQQRFQHRRKSHFRPRPEWFAEMGGELARPEPVVYDEQNDQPAVPYNQDNSPLLDLVFEDYEIRSNSREDESGKFARSSISKLKGSELFQTICPTYNKTINFDNDLEYEYEPKMFTLFICTNPYTHPESRLKSSPNKVCKSIGGECLQKKKDVLFVRRRRTPGQKNTNCWEPVVLNLETHCECMWSCRTNGNGKIQQCNKSNRN